jgi:hypothetical protein
MALNRAQTGSGRAKMVLNRAQMVQDRAQTGSGRAKMVQDRAQTASGHALTASGHAQIGSDRAQTIRDVLCGVQWPPVLAKYVLAFSREVFDHSALIGDA